MSESDETEFAIGLITLVQRCMLGAILASRFDAAIFPKKAADAKVLMRETAFPSKKHLSPRDAALMARYDGAFDLMVSMFLSGDLGAEVADGKPH